jgi:hypothetical protein
MTYYAWQVQDPTDGYQWGLIAGEIPGILSGPLITRKLEICQDAFGPIAMLHRERTGHRVRMVRLELGIEEVCMAQREDPPHSASEHCIDCDRPEPKCVCEDRLRCSCGIPDSVCVCAGSSSRRNFTADEWATALCRSTPQSAVNQAVTPKRES